MQEAARRRLGAGLDGMTVAVQGLGNVGSALCALLHDAGARLIVAEPRPGVAAAVALRYGAEIMGRESILDARCDIFAPCALGGVIDRDAIRRLLSRIVCGGATNVLARLDDGRRLTDRDVHQPAGSLGKAGGTPKTTN